MNARGAGGASSARGVCVRELPVRIEDLLTAQV
jgi:hypothetical protein